MIRVFGFFFLLASLAWGGLPPAGPPAQKGDFYPHLALPSMDLYDVEIRGMSPGGVILLHQAGLTQLPLAHLPEEWQAFFGFTPADARIHQQRQEELTTKARQRHQATVQAAADRQSARQTSSFEELLQRFGQPVIAKPEFSLKQGYFQYGLYIKNQGLRPSCSVFAVVGALEYLYARHLGRAEVLSEEYLIWATRRVLGRDRQSEDWKDGEEMRDAGFPLLTVLQALRAYGIPGITAMPNTFGSGMHAIHAPPEALIEEARHRRRLEAFAVPGDSNESRIEGILHILHAGYPVVIGLHWPHHRTLRHTSLLSRQEPLEGYAHAVTLIGYRLGSESDGELRFEFRNSWGNRWGNNGHGWVTYPYLLAHLREAIFLHVQ